MQTVESISEMFPFVPLWLSNIKALPLMMSVVFDVISLGNRLSRSIYTTY